MGAWDVGSFDNDDAEDWAAEFEESPSMSAVIESLERAIASRYVEAPEGSIAIAAAEVVAAVAGNASPALPAGIAAWATKQPRQEGIEKLALARKAVARVTMGKSSELRELWEDSTPAEWQAAIADLEECLAD
jgi:hypothetical protein